MGSLTVRNVPEAVKQRLRLRAARNGRSMEEEIRHLLAGGAAPAPDIDRTPAQAAATPPPASLADRRVLLIIGGGIAAYKALDLIRRLRERGASARVVMT